MRTRRGAARLCAAAGACARSSAACSALPALPPLFLAPLDLLRTTESGRAASAPPGPRGVSPSRSAHYPRTPDRRSRAGFEYLDPLLSCRLVLPLGDARCQHLQPGFPPDLAHFVAHCRPRLARGCGGTAADPQGWWTGPGQRCTHTLLPVLRPQFAPRCAAAGPWKLHVGQEPSPRGTAPGAPAPHISPPVGSIQATQQQKERSSQRSRHRESPQTILPGNKDPEPTRHRQ